ncbi:putative heterokaryon incompatibility protein [Eutypa lata UCREL1]|uniref:Putative heterokaryon incompatibility protein n=1 Tax=Eutypa lata (strain UCR-EL1) TaxID=1287681 RepID=M7SEY2_EUTLA|nr:putative heterokaryon incompatibility protein [Eutypa lata UCREL1]
MLCAVCQDIFACKAPATATVSPFGKFTEYISFTRAHHRSLDGFLSSARQKCFICYLLLERACESYGFREPELSVGGEDSNAGEFSVVSLGTTRFTTDAVEQKAPALNVGVSIRAGAFGDQRKTDVAVGFQIWPPGDSMQNPAPEKNVAMTCTDENRKAQGHVLGSSQVISSMEDTEVELECESIDLLVLNRSETSRRGWIFQERLLSNRILHMDSGQWYWQCDNTWVSEWRPDFSGPSPTSAGSRSSFHPLDSHLHENSQHAPSWSWAAVNKSVAFGSRTLYDSEAELLKSNDRVLELVDIHCVSTTPLAEDPFGEVVGGQIELSGWLLPQRTNQVLELTDSSDNDSFSFPLKQATM